MLTLADLMIAPEPATEEDLSVPFDLDRTLVEAAKEIDVDWPEFLPVQRIKARIAKTVLGLLLLARISVPGPKAPNSPPAAIWSCPLNPRSKERRGKPSTEAENL